MPCLAQLGFQFGIGRFVERVTGLDALKIDAAELLVEDESAIFDFPNAGALFEVAVFSSIEDHAITWSDGDAGGVGQGDPAAAAFIDGAEQGSAFFAEAAVSEVGVIGAAEPTVGEATGEGHFQGVAIGIGDGGFRLCHRIIEGLAVDASDGGDVLGRFESALDFERLHAGFHQIGDEVDCGEVLRAEEVADFTEILGDAIDHDFVGHAAGLGAFAAVRAALAEGFAGQALTRVGDAKGAVDKNFEWGFEIEGGVFASAGFEAFDFPNRKLASEHGAFHGEERLHEGESFGGGDGHLGRRVEFHIRRDRASELGEAEVLDDQGIDIGRGDFAQLCFGGFQFAGEDEGVHCHESLHAMAVKVVHEFRQVFIGEIIGAESGVEAWQPEVDCIRPSRDGRTCAVPVSSWGEQFRGGIGSRHARNQPRGWRK